MDLRLTASVFADGEPIPARLTGECAPPLPALEATMHGHAPVEAQQTGACRKQRA